MLKKWSVTILALLLPCYIISGCAGENTAGDKSKTPQNHDPITLLVYGNVNHNASDFDNFFVSPVKKKFPYITLKLIERNTMQPEELLNSGTIPDIIYDSPPALVDFQKLDMIEVLDDYLKKYNVDISQYEQTAVEMVRMYQSDGKLLAIPLFLNFSALFYNKDIFDKFAVPYPKDGMSWENAIEIARKVTRSADGIQYRGLDPGVILPVSGQLSLPFVDAKSEKAALDTDGWKKVFQFMENVYGIPGNRPDPQDRNVNKVRDSFYKNLNLAMMADWGINSIGELGKLYNKGVVMNWDMVSLPYFSENPGVSRKVDAHLLMLSKGSKYKDEAFQVMKLLTSEEAETAAAKAGELPSLTKPEIVKNYGQDLAVLKNKNMNVIFTFKPAKQFVPTLFDKFATSAANNAYNLVYSGQKDINTALREAEETANKAIAEQKAQ